ncbi:macro domain-containing protein [Agrobacterium rubi]|nr:macro domain-containing protein [Agrobacterium rubi]NTF24175.1 macro domain-containing protein [Agrobacterium rubi]
MIIQGKGNILDTNDEAVVNTVNEQGVMGKGLALEFKIRFPDNFTAYEVACKRNEVKVGQMFVTERMDMFGPRWLINFPTKQYWRNGSRLEWVRAGLDDLRTFITARSIRSISVPPLGCGNGGLDWRVVRPLIVDKLGNLPDCAVSIFEPID